MTDTNNTRRVVNQYTALPMPSRFWAKVDRSGGDEACWLWRGSAHRQGYGMFRFGDEILAHRIAWIISNGEIPDNMCVCHNCPSGDNPSCVNPAHMFLGTQADNVHDMMAKDRAVIVVNAGESCGHSKLKQKQVDEIRLRHAAGGVTQTKLAQEYNISVSAISMLINRKTWK